jgi:hypothetical protein
MKICSKCNVSKTENDFAKNGKNGLHSACKQCACNAAKLWRETNPEIAKERDRVKHEKHRIKRLSKMREYNLQNADKRAEIERQRYILESEKIKTRNAAYRYKNPALVQAWNNGRRATERRATPEWVDYRSIAKIYELAANLTFETGEKHHVDHIVPLKGKNVCGLHVPHNLQVITATENLKKGCKFENS